MIQLLSVSACAVYLRICECVSKVSVFVFVNACVREFAGCVLVCVFKRMCVCA